VVPLDFKRNTVHCGCSSHVVFDKNATDAHADMPAHPQESDALRGSIDLLVLKALALQPMHGWGIGVRIQQISQGRFDVNQGSLYPALQRLEHRGWVDSEWGPSDNNRRARYYTLTRAGRRALGEEVDKWKRFASTMALVLES
jgi:PadR family transcriptional regulator PadR